MMGRGWPRWCVALGLAVVLAIAVALTFRAYLRPEHVAQWASLLQLCR